ncbi:hypothetical protein HK098_004349 [Nowakowskiella sp. JEL0407]|nr:hypothetical protein HK098_004349 [Nowakowskiella sp. JEL0407]
MTTRLEISGSILFIVFRNLSSLQIFNQHSRTGKETDKLILIGAASFTFGWIIYVIGIGRFNLESNIPTDGLVNDFFIVMCVTSVIGGIAAVLNALNSKYINNPLLRAFSSTSISVIQTLGGLIIGLLSALVMSNTAKLDHYYFILIIIGVIAMTSCGFVLFFLNQLQSEDEMENIKLRIIKNELNSIKQPEMIRENLLNLLRGESSRVFFHLTQNRELWRRWKVLQLVSLFGWIFFISGISSINSDIQEFFTPSALISSILAALFGFVFSVVLVYAMLLDSRKLVLVSIINYTFFVLTSGFSFYVICKALSTTAINGSNQIALGISLMGLLLFFFNSALLWTMVLYRIHVIPDLDPGNNMNFKWRKIIWMQIISIVGIIVVAVGAGLYINRKPGLQTGEIFITVIAILFSLAAIFTNLVHWMLAIPRLNEIGENFLTLPWNLALSFVAIGLNGKNIIQSIQIFSNCQQSRFNCEFVVANIVIFVGSVIFVGFGFTAVILHILYGEPLKKSVVELRSTNLSSTSQSVFSWRSFFSFETPKKQGEMCLYEFTLYTPWLRFSFKIYVAAMVAFTIFFLVSFISLGLRKPEATLGHILLALSGFFLSMLSTAWIYLGSPALLNSLILLLSLISIFAGHTITGAVRMDHYFAAVASVAILNLFVVLIASAWSLSFLQPNSAHSTKNKVSKILVLLMKFIGAVCIVAGTITETSHASSDQISWILVCGVCVICSILDIVLDIISRRMKQPTVNMIAAISSTLNAGIAGAAFQNATSSVNSDVNFAGVVGSIMIAVSHLVYVLVKISAEEFDLPPKFRSYAKTDSETSITDNPSMWKFSGRKIKTILYLLLGLISIGYVISTIGIITVNETEISSRATLAIENFSIDLSVKWVTHFYLGAGLLCILYAIAFLALRWDVLAYCATLAGVSAAFSGGFTINSSAGPNTGIATIVGTGIFLLVLSALFGTVLIGSKQTETKISSIFKIISVILNVIGVIMVAVSIILSENDKYALLSGAKWTKVVFIQVGFCILPVLGVIAELMLWSSNKTLQDMISKLFKFSKNSQKENLINWTSFNVVINFLNISICGAISISAAKFLFSAVNPPDEFITYSALSLVGSILILFGSSMYLLVKTYVSLRYPKDMTIPTNILPQTTRDLNLNADDAAKDSVPKESASDIVSTKSHGISLDETSDENCNQLPVDSNDQVTEEPSGKNPSSVVDIKETVDNSMENGILENIIEISTDSQSSNLNVNENNSNLESSSENTESTAPSDERINLTDSKSESISSSLDIRSVTKPRIITNSIEETGIESIQNNSKSYTPIRKRQLLRNSVTSRQESLRTTSIASRTSSNLSFGNREKSSPRNDSVDNISVEYNPDTHQEQFSQSLNKRWLKSNWTDTSVEDIEEM